jgi:hypothetical protein
MWVIMLPRRTSADHLPWFLQTTPSDWSSWSCCCMAAAQFQQASPSWTMVGVLSRSLCNITGHLAYMPGRGHRYISQQILAMPTAAVIMCAAVAAGVMTP